MILFIITLLINIGMWFERFNIIVISLSKKNLNPALGDYISLRGLRLELQSEVLHGSLCSS